MPVDLSKSFVIAISARALFDLTDAHQVFLEQGLQAYCDYQIAHEDDILKPGPGFALVKALLSLNSGDERDDNPVEVIIMSHNGANTSMRIFNSIDHYGLNVSRAALTSGSPLTQYLKAYSTGLFLSATEEDVWEAHQAGVAAAMVYDNPIYHEGHTHQIRIAFDGDAVIFSDESERIFQERGLDAFVANERANAKVPLNEGPLCSVLRALYYLKNNVPNGNERIRLALITARNNQSIERVIRTLRKWGINIDEAFFMGGVSKTEILRAFGAQIFFDDQAFHCESAKEVVSAAKVPSNIFNKKKHTTGH